MSTQFKAGDRALFSGEIPGTNHRYHSPVEVQIKEVHGNYVEAVFPDRGPSWSVWVNQLTPIDQPAHKFKVGDKVRIIGNRTSHPDPGHTCIYHNSAQFNGKTGCIMDKARPGFGDWLIVLEGDRHYSFFADELELISPQSPQPQQTKSPYDAYTSAGYKPKPKEDDMKRYAVIYKNMATNDTPSINSVHATEAEAKLAGEQIVAQQRQTLVEKKFFSVSILDTHTGTLIGSVVDAPPAVDWNAGK